MSVIDDYLQTLSGAEKTVIAHMYDIIRQTVPDATEELSYAMPAFKYQGKGLVSIIATKHFLSLYPFCSLDRLGLDFSGYETTKGSLHFSVEHQITDEFLKQILAARLKLTD